LYPKIKILTKNRNFGQKSEFRPKIEIMGKKMKISAKNLIFKNQNFSAPQF